MTLNGVMALVLRYFTEFGSFRGAMRKMVENVVAISSPDEFLLNASSTVDFRQDNAFSVLLQITTLMEK